MTPVDLNRLKGNYAEYTVATWLSRVALVRPVAEGTDIGVDLYCESIIGGSPYLHFWVQVKAVPPSNISFNGDKEIAWFDFETRHLQYWAHQPIPVYVFLVPLEKWPPLLPKRIYSVRITDYILRHGIPNKSKARIKSPDWIDIETIESDLEQFVTEIIPWDTAALLIQKGIIAPVPDPHNSLEKRFPAGIGFPYLDKILESIRDTSVLGLVDALAAEQHNPDKRPIRRQFEAIAELFEDELHVLGLTVLVRAAHTDGAIEKAKTYIAKAVARIEQDPKLDIQAKREKIAQALSLLDDFK